MAEISHLADCQQQPKLGKRKAVEQVAPRASQEQSKPSLEAQPLPASEASQQEGARKRTRTRKSRGPGLGQEARQSRKDMMQNGRSLTLEAAAMLPAVLPRHGQSGAGSGEDGQPDVHQSLPGNPARDSAPSAQAPESVRKKRSRNKFKPDATAGQPGLPKSTDAAPAAQTPDAAKKKRNRNKFKQMDAAGPEVLPKSLVPEVGEHHSSKHDAAAPHKKAAKQQGLLAQRSPEPAPSAMQHDKESEQRPGKQMKGTAKRQESKAAGHPMRPPQSAGQAENGQATSGGQVAGAGASSRQKEDGLLGKMRAKLAGSQFRWLNEQLYTCPGSQAFELMQEQPQLFTQYHEVRSIPAWSRCCTIWKQVLRMSMLYATDCGAGCKCAVLHEAHWRAMEASAVKPMGQTRNQGPVPCCRASSSRQPSGLCSQYRRQLHTLLSTAERPWLQILGVGMLSWRAWRLRRLCTAWTLSAARLASLHATWLTHLWVHAPVISVVPCPLCGLAHGEPEI